MIGRIAMSLMGSSLGAAVMYLMDPESGAKHRKRLRRRGEEMYDRAAGTYETAVESAGPAWETVKERAGETAVHWRARLADALAGASRRVAPTGEAALREYGVEPEYYRLEPEVELSPRQQMTALALARHSRDLHGQAREAYARARDMYFDSLIDLELARARWRREMPKQAKVRQPAVEKTRAKASSWLSFGASKKRTQSPDYLTISLVAAGCCALGAAAMFITDPVAGRRRRALVRDKAYKAVHRAGDAVSGGVKGARYYVGGPARGMAARATSAVRSHDVESDQKLEARVKSELGHVISHPHGVSVKAVNGCVTLSGSVLASEFDGLMKCVYSVSGVREVVNQMQTHTTLGANV